MSYFYNRKLFSHVNTVHVLMYCLWVFLHFPCCSPCELRDSLEENKTLNKGNIKYIKYSICKATGQNPSEVFKIYIQYKFTFFFMYPRQEMCLKIVLGHSLIFCLVEGLVRRLFLLYCLYAKYLVTASRQ